MIISVFSDFTDLIYKIKFHLKRQWGMANLLYLQCVHEWVITKSKLINRIV